MGHGAVQPPQVHRLQQLNLTAASFTSGWLLGTRSMMPLTVLLGIPNSLARRLPPAVNRPLRPERPFQCRGPDTGRGSCLGGNYGEATSCDLLKPGLPVATGHRQEATGQTGWRR